MEFFVAKWNRDGNSWLLVTRQFHIRYLFQKRRGTVEALPVDECNLAILVV